MPQNGAEAGCRRKAIRASPSPPKPTPFTTASAMPALFLVPDPHLPRTRSSIRRAGPAVPKVGTAEHTHKRRFFYGNGVAARAASAWTRPAPVALESQHAVALKTATLLWS